MFKYLLPLLFTVSSSWAQDLSNDLQFIETQNTLSTPLSVPLYVNLLGEISIINNSVGSGMAFTPMGHASAKISKALYIKPIQQDSLSFSEQRSQMNWLEVKRERWEVGAGIGALIADSFLSVGLVPYKGALQIMVRQKASKEEKTKRPLMPKRLDRLGEWRVGDLGSFQRFGGLQLTAGAKIAGVSLLSGGIIIQNLWRINLAKQSASKVLLTFSEEHLTKRRVQAGTAIVNGKMNFFKGKRLSLEFVLDLNRAEDHELYQLALRGKVDRLQELLPVEAQKMHWTGSERLTFFGIPGVIGKHIDRSQYDMHFEDEDDVLNIKSGRSSGILVPKRNHHKLVFQTDKSVALFWYSEMKKANSKVLRRRFLKPGLIIGVRGFDQQLPEGTKLGSTISQMGVSFSRDEIEHISPAVLEEILTNFRARCGALKLPCRKNGRYHKIARELRSFRGQKWEKFRGDFGFLLLKEPALIHAYVKTLRTQKKVYFKFLNEKYQSVEGAALIQ